MLQQDERKLDLQPREARPRRGYPLLILAVALSVRLGVVFITHTYLQIEHTEVVRVATSLARQGTFANAFGPNTGPTAHVSPLYPILLSLVFRVWGTDVPGEIAQEILSCLFASLTFAALPALGTACGLDPVVGNLGGMLGALLPVNFWAETKGSFEAPLAALMLVLLCVLLIRCWRSSDFSPGSALATGIVSGLGQVTSPSLAPVVITSLLVGYWQKGQTAATQYFRFCAIVIATSAVCLAPWAIRNYLVLGAPVWSRSGLGNELFISNNDAAAANWADNLNSGWFQRSHPYYSATERTKVRSMGELPYQRAKMTEATGWIIAHPGRFSQLTAEHIFYFWCPGMKRRPQSILMAVFALGGLSGLAMMLRSGYQAAWLFIAVLTSYPVIYYFVESFARYRCPVDWMLVFLSAFGIRWFGRPALVRKHQGRATDTMRAASHP